MGGLKLHFFECSYLSSSLHGSEGTSGQDRHNLIFVFLRMKLVVTKSVDFDEIEFLEEDLGELVIETRAQIERFDWSAITIPESVSKLTIHLDRKNEINCTIDFKRLTNLKELYLFHVTHFHRFVDKSEFCLRIYVCHNFFKRCLNNTSSLSQYRQNEGCAPFRNFSEKSN